MSESPATLEAYRYREALQKAIGEMTVYIALYQPCIQQSLGIEVGKNAGREVWLQRSLREVHKLHASTEDLVLQATHRVCDELESQGHIQAGDQLHMPPLLRELTDELPPEARILYGE